MEEITNYKSKLPDPKGISTINHGLRHKMGLDCNEYVLMEYFIDVQEKRQAILANPISEVFVKDSYVVIGFSEKAIIALMNRLVEKGFLHYEEAECQITDKWNSFFDNLDKQFEKFWVEERDANGKKVERTAWPGSKPEARKLFEAVVKKIGFDKLMSQRRDYFRLLALQKEVNGFDRARMMATVFLNPTKERYAEDFLSEVVELEKKKKEKDGNIKHSLSAPVSNASNLFEDAQTIPMVEREESEQIELTNDHKTEW